MIAGAAASGFAASLSLILAIGAQNAFMLRQGLLRQHVLELALLFAFSDALLISAGVLGFGTLVRLSPLLPQIMSIAGALFLLSYGALRLISAWRGGAALAIGEEAGRSRRSVLLTGAAFTWLNPHVYLDTLALLGAISTGFPPGTPRLAFAAGAIAASFVFFLALGFGARLLAPLMRAPLSWRLLDIGMAAVMWLLAASLLRQAFAAFG